jgi:hypothetical protein
MHSRYAPWIPHWQFANICPLEAFQNIVHINSVYLVFSVDLDNLLSWSGHNKALNTVSGRISIQGNPSHMYDSAWRLLFCMLCIFSWSYITWNKPSSLLRCVNYASHTEPHTCQGVWALSRFLRHTKVVYNLPIKAGESVTLYLLVSILIFYKCSLRSVCRAFIVV